jgi:tRNA A-37 threonylcarbamoyl transferase component Bud32
MSPNPSESTPKKNPNPGAAPATGGEPKPASAAKPSLANASEDGSAAASRSAADATGAARETTPPGTTSPAQTGVASTAIGAADGPITALEMQFGDEDELATERAGDVLGRYTLVRRLGRGGFGAVWEAEQSVPVRRTVALKILHVGMDTRAVVARFEQERQALAVMDHPHVARVLDAGATEKGRPYFVMDLVRGEPLDAFCARRGAPLRERLALFAQVCFAVQHAHGKGVIHRDLKPSNILVGEADGKPHATVIDFGIAKAISPAAAGGDVHTAARQIMGTALYMSPEQAAGSLDLDTRTDVYSLGVVLYELLTGSTPIPRPTHGSVPPHEVARLLQETDPQAPSSRLLSSHEAGTGAPGARRLAANVRGELDWIVMKALEKDRARRYQTASDFAADIERHLRGEPVSAAPPSAAYRLRKLVRRHKAAFFAAGALLGALLSGVAGFAWQAREAARERDAAREARRLAEIERTRAEANARTAQAVNRFVDDMLASADVRFLGRDAKVVQVLDRSSSLVGAAFPDDPAVEFGVRRMLGRTERISPSTAAAWTTPSRAMRPRSRPRGPPIKKTPNSASRSAATTRTRWSARSGTRKGSQSCASWWRRSVAARSARPGRTSSCSTASASRCIAPRSPTRPRRSIASRSRWASASSARRRAIRSSRA